MTLRTQLGFYFYFCEAFFLQQADALKAKAKIYVVKPICIILYVYINISHNKGFLKTYTHTPKYVRALICLSKLGWITVPHQIQRNIEIYTESTVWTTHFKTEVAYPCYFCLTEIIKGNPAHSEDINKQLNL